MEKIPPYFHNFDGTHCLQCALRSALEYFQPEKKWTWEELDGLTGKIPGKGTWQMTFLANLSDLGYEVACIEGFDLEKFVGDHEQYLKETYSSPEMYKYMMENLDLDKEIKASERLLEAQKKGKAKLYYRDSTAQDVRDYLKDGYFIMHWVNHYKLHHREGFEGHMLLLYQLEDENTVRVHENGGMYENQPTGSPQMQIDIDFLVECATSDGKTGGFYAIRPKQHA